MFALANRRLVEGVLTVPLPKPRLLKTKQSATARWPGIGVQRLTRTKTKGVRSDDEWADFTPRTNHRFLSPRSRSFKTDT